MSAGIEAAVTGQWRAVETPAARTRKTARRSGRTHRGDRPRLRQGRTTLGSAGMQQRGEEWHESPQCVSVSRGSNERSLSPSFIISGHRGAATPLRAGERRVRGTAAGQLMMNDSDNENGYSSVRCYRKWLLHPGPSKCLEHRCGRVGGTDGSYERLPVDSRRTVSGTERQ